MDCPSPETNLPESVRDCLVRMQQILLKKGYEYRAGDEGAWPATPVLLVKDECRILVTPYWAGTAEEVQDAWAQDEWSSGLILVGAIPPDSPELRDLFSTAKRKVAYVDAAAGTFRTKMKWWSASGDAAALLKSNLKKFVDPKVRHKVARIDCLTQLREHLQQEQEAERFQMTAARVSRFQVPLLSCGMVVLFVTVFIFMTIVYGLRMLVNPPVEGLLDWGALHGPLVKDGQWWRMFSVALLHGGFMHLGCNCLFMLVFGTLLEMYQGLWRTWVYFAAGVAAGSIASIWWHPAIVGVGASGGLFGLLGALAALVVRQRREFPRHVWKNWRKMVLVLLAYNILVSLRPHIDAAAHFGGLIGGFAVALVVGRSPVRVCWPPVWVWPALLALLIGGLFLTKRVIAHIPPDTPSIARRMAIGKNASRDLALLEQLDRETIRRDRLIEKAERMQYAVGPTRSRSITTIRSEILPKLGPDFVNTLKVWKERASHNEARKAVQLAADLNAERVQYCRLIVKVIEGSANPDDLIPARITLSVYKSFFTRQRDLAVRLLEFRADR